MKMTNMLFGGCILLAAVSYWLMTIHTWPWNLFYAMGVGCVVGIIIGTDDVKKCPICHVETSSNGPGYWVCYDCLDKLKKTRLYVNLTRHSHA